MTLKEDIEKATSAHARWKASLKDAIESGLSLATASSMKSDHECRFGRWLLGPELSPAVKASSHYLKVGRLHAEFHQAASQVIDLALSGNEPEAIDSISRGGSFQEISESLILAMKEWHESL